MRKFLSNLYVMISFVVLAVLFAGLTVGLLVRPLSYGWTYGVEVYGVEHDSVPGKFKISGDEATLSYFDSEENKDVEGVYYVVRDGSRSAIYMVPITEENKKEDIKKTADELYKTLKDEEKDKFYNGDFFRPTGGDAFDGFTYEHPELNVFAIVDLNSNTYYVHVLGFESLGLQGYCTGAIVYTVVMSVVTTALATFAVLSVVFYVKSKKKTETTAE